jgi:DNA segregation ATPase FtsK/SpoIIIE-like protein
MELNDFCNKAAMQIANGLATELGIVYVHKDESTGKDRGHYWLRGYSTSRVLSVRLVGIEPSYLPKVKRMQKQLTLWAGLSDEYQVRIGHDEHAILIEVPKPKTFWDKVTIEDLESKNFIRKGAVATLGLGLMDNPIRVNFSNPATAHVFITGQTRSGKTNSEKLIAWNIARNMEPDKAKVLLLDVAKRGYNWTDFNNVSNLLHPVITDIETGDKVLAWLNQEIERRASKRYLEPKIFILIDELKALVDDSKVATDYLSRIASVGGEFGLHLILSTQYSQIQMLKSAELKRNVTTRLCGKVDSADAASNALGIKDSGAETLGGYGDFLLKDADNLARLTVAKIEAKHIEALERAEIVSLDLPEMDAVNNGPNPDPLQPEMVALALFEPELSYGKFAKHFNIGTHKVKRIKEFADSMRAWAIENGYNCLPE